LLGIGSTNVAEYAVATAAFQTLRILSRWRNSMRLLIPTVLIAVGAIAASNIACAQQLIGAPGVPPAPIGHLQPRADGFTSGSDANQAEQHRLSVFDAEQRRLDDMLDKKLNICRC
jgi:hypothetical protein